MKRSFLVIGAILGLFILTTGSCRPKEQNTETIFFDLAQLDHTKVELGKGNPEYRPAFDQLILEADRALQEGPYSVTHKEKLPPSGDKHDYASYSRYWWPDPEKPDGLPYVRRDGDTYPGSQSWSESDRPRIGAFGVNTETLGLAYYLTGEEKYAKKAAELLRVWFLDEETHMNPNVNHAQCRLGHNLGTKSGVLDSRLLIRALEGSLLIKGSSYLSDGEYDQLRAWVAQYFEWLTTDEMALAEGASKNNHGSYYDVQALYFALYAGNLHAATDIAQDFIEKRVQSQIRLDGSMPEEMARTRPLFYSMYNLHAMFLVAHLAERVDVDVWQAHEGDSRLRAGLDYLVPYTDPNKSWPQPVLKEPDRMELYPILNMANRAYPEGDYLQLVNKLPIKERSIHRINLVSPVMR